MELTIGAQLGTYTIMALIGKGGMGEVYCAHDTRLGRDVAIKTLPEAFSHNPDSMARFEREARVLASLNHPNIAAIYGVESGALVMELVEGPTLADRIREGPIPLEESLAIARQIAEALEAAHEKGVTHRDLKPANIKIRTDGAVKVLDFGLAKVGPGTAAGADPQESPTLSLAATQAGVILGTAAYMAPEQARGKPVDKRADIWAFGAVLYEMVTGRRLFRGDDLTDTLAAVVRDTPDLTPAPPPLRRLLEACLQKEPRQRLRDIADVWKLLDTAPAKDLPHAKSRSWLWPVVVVSTLILAAIGLWVMSREPPALPELVKLELTPPAGTAFGKFAVSPDGHKIAYFAVGTANNGLWVRSLDDLTAMRVGGNLEGAGTPSFFWSADSRFVAFPGGNPFNWLMAADSVVGGAPEVKAKIDTSVVGGSWSLDGTILFGSITPGVWQISAAGGTPVQLTAYDASLPSQCNCSPILLPDGKHFLYLISTAPTSESGIFLGSIDAKPEEQNRKRIVATPFTGGFVPTADPKIGILLFLQDAVLLAQPMDLRTFELTGTPTRLASGVGNAVEFGAFSASSNVLAYHSGPTQSSLNFALRWLNLKGEAAGTSPGGSLVQASLFHGVALSPDGRRVAVSRVDPGSGQEDIWLLDSERSDAVLRLTSGAARHWDPVWSPDGNQIAYVATGEQGGVLARRPSSGSGVEEVVLPANGKERDLNQWSHDGRLLLFTEQDEKKNSDIWVVPLDGERKPEVFLNSEFNETQGQLSPDGHWIAYVSDETGAPQIYVQPFPREAGSGVKITISNENSFMPRWRRDGKGLFYHQVAAGNNRFMAVDFESKPTPKAGVPRQLFQSTLTFGDQGIFRWDVGPSEDRFLFTGIPIVQQNDTALTVVLNWQTMLEKAK